MFGLARTENGGKFSALSPSLLLSTHRQPELESSSETKASLLRCFGAHCLPSWEFLLRPRVLKQTPRLQHRGSPITSCTRTSRSFPRRIQYSSAVITVESILCSPPFISFSGLHSSEVPINTRNPAPAPQVIRFHTSPLESSIPGCNM